MNTQRIDIANIGLMIMSCILAYLVPFELFLFSYAVLGPLHYLTEITWLRQRDYFTNGKKDYLGLVIPCVVLTIITIVSYYKETPAVGAVYDFLSSIFGEKFTDFSNFMLYVGFIAALAFVAFKDVFYKIIFLIIAVFVGLLMQNTESFIFFFAIFLPTLIHVFIFTAFFIIFGALKNRSVTGIASVVVLITCALLFFIWKPVFGFYNVGDYAQKAFIMEGKGLVNVNVAFMQIFNMGKITMETVFHSPVGLSVGRFVAFAYTYHYLNWFSKTEVIKWHKVPAKWLATVIALWIFSVALYAYNYKTGLMALYFLSMLHVFLEFPLNYRSVIGISEEIGTLTGLRKAPVPQKVKK